MNRETIIGMIVIIGSLTLMSALVWRSKYIIDKLASTKPKSIRDAMRDLGHGK